jgi:hypothetical protein
MIENYLKELDNLILAADEILDAKILRRSVWDTDLERIALYRYKVYFSDGSLLELTERMVEEKDKLTVTKYRFHWQDKGGKLVKRWDNARHHPGINTFPDHLHEGSDDNVIPHKKINGLEVLSKVIDEVGKNRK